MASASANRGELARPQPRRLTIRVTSPADLGIEVFKAPNAFITIPEMADDASPPPWGWSVAQKSRMGTTDTVGGIVRAAAHRLTHELPDFMKELPQIRAQVEALEKILLCSEPFTFVVHEYDDPADGAEFSLEGESAVRGAHRESWGDAGEAPAGLLSLDADGLANFILSDACRSIVVLDGAGMSTASGIPDYRGPTGLYSTLEPGRLTASAEEREKLRVDPSFIAHIDLFRANPLPLLEVKRDFIRGVAAGRWLPTAGHHLLALLQRAGKLKRVFTQNIDGLHRVAGVDPGRLTEVHGTMSAARCSGCGAPMDMDTFAKEVSRRVRDIHATDSRDSSAPAESTAGGVPCPKECGEGSVKPAVVLFGQPIADSFSGDCAGDLPTADLLLVMGTSLTVPPVDTVPKLVGSKCMRVVVNGTRVGDRLGMVFDAPEARRDLLLKGNIDDVVVDLAGRLGWLDELGKRTETMAPNSAAVVCAALADRKARP